MDRTRRQWHRDPYIIALAVILLVNLLLKWRFFTGLAQADDFSYGVYAYTLFHGEWPWNQGMDFRMMRYGIMFPAALVFLVLPPTELTAVLFPMLASFGTIVVVYVIGRKLFGPNAGILAAFVLATFPADIIFSTMLLPDIVVPFYLALAVWFFLTAEDAPERKARLYYALSGAAVFLAFVTRENSYYFALFYLPFAFSATRWKRGLWLIPAGFILPVLLLFAYYWGKTGDFLFIVHLASEARDSLVQSGYIPGNLQNLLTQLYYMMPFFFGDHQATLSPMYGMIFYAGIPCLAYTAVKTYISGNRRALIVPWWFVIVYLFLEFGSLSFTEYQVMKKLPRFLLTLTPPMAVGFGVAFADAFGWGRKAFRHAREVVPKWSTAVPALVVTAFMLYTSWGVCAYQDTSRERNMRQFRWANEEVFGDLPPLPVYSTGGWWFNKLSFYLVDRDIDYAHMSGALSPLFHDLMGENAEEVEPSSYVIIDRKHFSGDNDLRIRHSYGDAPWYVKAPPDAWELLGRNYLVEIYRVPDGWMNVPPSGEELLRQTVSQALETGDPVLFLYCLHPDTITGLTNETFYRLFNTMREIAAEGPSALYTEAVEIVPVDGTWKLLLHFNE